MVHVFSEIGGLYHWVTGWVWVDRSRTEPQAWLMDGGHKMALLSAKCVAAADQKVTCRRRHPGSSTIQVSYRDGRGFICEVFHPRAYPVKRDLRAGRRRNKNKQRKRMRKALKRRARGR